MNESLIDLLPISTEYRVIGRWSGNTQLQCVYRYANHLLDRVALEPISTAKD